jgi:hypothetical protein
MKNLKENITNGKDPKYVIYVTTNLVNYKKYIGSHVCEDINDGYLGSGTYFKQSLKECGKENFKREILAVTDCPEIMKSLEEYYIDYYGAYMSELFYNKSRKGVGYPYGRKKPKWHCENLRKAHLGKSKGHKGRVSPMKGKTQSIESKEKARLNNIGKNNKIIVQFDLNGNFIKEWESQTIAAQFLGKKTGAAIGECAKGKRPTIYGYKWMYKEN